MFFHKHQHTRIAECMCLLFSICPLLNSQWWCWEFGHVMVLITERSLSCVFVQRIKLQSWLTTLCISHLYMEISQYSHLLFGYAYLRSSKRSGSVWVRMACWRFIIRGMTCNTSKSAFSLTVSLLRRPRFGAVTTSATGGTSCPLPCILYRLEMSYKAQCYHLEQIVWRGL